MRKEIVIIGGGIAGLSAASALVRNNCAVTILEAKERVGGRIHTIRDGTLPIELGAEFLHGESQTILNAIEAAGLSTHDVSDRYRLLEKGKLKPVKFWDKMSDIIHRIDPKAADCSFQEFIDGQRLKERDRAQAIGFIQGFHAAHPGLIGAHSLLRGETAAEQMNNQRQSRVNEGYSALVDFMEREIHEHGGKFLLGSTVKSVRWKPGKVEVDISRGNGVEKIKADAIVITLPLGVLKSGAVEFNPPLAEKLEAINGLQFGNVIKIVFVFQEKWWPKKDFGFVQALEEDIPTWWSDPRGPVLTGWAGGPKADALKKFSASQLEQRGLEVLEKIFDVPPLREKLEVSHTYDWSRDPHVLGAYSYIPPNGLDLPKLLGAPVRDTLFFAGEATVTDAQTGTVFSAFETGLRAAREVLGKKR